MFTGIIKEIGTVKSHGRTGVGYRLDIEVQGLSKSAGTGDSVAVNGVCLTLTGKNKNVLSFDVMDETIGKTALGRLSDGCPVNLEDAIRADGAFGGHFVTGHVDCIGRIREVDKGGDVRISVEVPEGLAHLLVEKGSVCVDGVSLTVGGIRNNVFNLFIIPHTLKATTLGSKKSGDMVNIEFDIIGKYCARLIENRFGSRVNEGFLKAKGFC